MKLVLISPERAGRNRVMQRNEFLKINVSIPPLNEQRKIANILNALDLSIKSEKQKKKSIESIFTSLLNNLMTTKIRVNDLKF